MPLLTCPARRNSQAVPGFRCRVWCWATP